MTTSSHFEILCAQSSDPLLLVRSDSSIAWANRASDRLFGRSPVGAAIDDLLGRPVREFLGKLSHYGSVEATVSSPHLGDVSQTAVVVDIGSGGLDGELFLIALKSTSAESSAVRAREEWLTAVAHDLKNPLGAIFGYADTLLDTRLGSSMNQQQRDVIVRIRATAARATELVRNYQHLSQLELRAAGTSSAVIDLNAVVSDVVNSTWREDPAEPRVILELDPELPRVRLERLHLERVVSNLFTNALKFSPAETPVALTTGADSNYVIFTISNFGPIITPEDASNLFKPFTRLPSARNHPGSGLGLAIVKRILDGVGGSVSVEHTLERGNTFTVRLPR